MKTFLKNNKIIIGSIAFIILIVLLFTFKIPLTSVFADNDKTKLPILIYHDFTNDTSKLSAFTLSFDQFEKDLQYIEAKGYNTITMKELIDYVYNDSELPSNPILISFDDGYESNYEAFKMLEKHRMNAVISIVGKYSDICSYGDKNELTSTYLTWDQIKEMNSTGVIEFLNHTYNMHTNTGERIGCTIIKDESLGDYQDALINDLSITQDKLLKTTGDIPKCFTYPYGFVSDESVNPLKSMGFVATFSGSQGMNIITKNPNCLFSLKRYNRHTGPSSKDFFKNVR